MIWCPALIAVSIIGAGLLHYMAIKASKTMKIYDEEVSTPREAAKAIAFSYRARMPIHLCNLLADEIENSITAFVLDERAAKKLKSPVRS